MGRRSIGTRLAGAFRTQGGSESGGSRTEQYLQELEGTRRALRESHDQLIEMERLAAAEEFASDVADAINNPLAALLGRLQMQLEGKPVDPEDERLYALATRIAAVVEGMSDLGKRRALSPREVPVPEIVEDAMRHVQVLAEERGVKLSTSLEPGMPPMFGDPPLLTRALSALLENAVEASAGGGQVELRVAKVAGAGAVRFRVLDEGPGIAPELRERVFDPFFSTRSGSLGLGLALARRIAAGHGGRIRIREGPGRGLVVTLDLPLPSPENWQPQVTGV
jgi:signal transduction histidine kinase